VANSANSNHFLGARPIILYDGVCGLCNRAIQFVLRRDKADRFRFAPLQSAFAANLLRRHGFHPETLDTMYVVLHHDLPEERLAARSDAVITILRELPAAWPALGALLSILPRPLRDWGYTLVARHRYRLFGRFEACQIPNARNRWKFLDLS
jgi:predicted DCC family thiol-disulfide oxidoreductase YuxK